MSDSNSSFTQDMTRMSRLCQVSQDHSLLFIDEFGKGTNPEDGIALFLSLVHYYLSCPVPHRYIFLSTHFSDYLTEELLGHSLSELTCKRMNVFLDTSNHHSVTPLFQVQNGICEDALGIEMAAKMNVPSSIVQRAEEIYACIHDNKSIEVLKGLSESSNLKMIDEVIDQLFKIKDWNNASSDDVQSLLQLMSSIHFSVC